jgi:hypothetical protein
VGDITRPAPRRTLGAPVIIVAILPVDYTSPKASAPHHIQTTARKTFAIPECSRMQDTQEHVQIAVVWQPKQRPVLACRKQHPPRNDDAQISTEKTTDKAPTKWSLGELLRSPKFSHLRRKGASRRMSTTKDHPPELRQLSLDEH